MSPTPLLAALLALASATAAATQPSRPAGSSSQGAGKAPEEERAPGLVGPLPEGPVQRDERAEQVLREAIRAHGGEQAIAGRQTIYLKYKIINYDHPEPEEGTITIWFKRPAKIRQEVAYTARKETVAFDGERAWRDDGTGPTLMGPLYARMMERGIHELDLPLLFMEGSLKYLSIAKDPQGRLTQKLSWRHQGYARDIMVDAATSLVLVIGEFATPAGAISRMRLLDDYRPVQGMMLAHHLETYRNDQKYSERDVLEVKFNVPIEDSAFQFVGPDVRSTEGKTGAAPAPPR